MHSFYLFVVNMFTQTDEGPSDQQSAWGIGRAWYDYEELPRNVC